MRAVGLGLVGACLVLGCSTIDGEVQPSEEGMYADEVGVEVDGVLVSCGNLDDANYFWSTDDEGPLRILRMPVVCMGPLTTPGFELDDAVPVEDGWQFPSWNTAIADRCAMACLDAHDPETQETPVCETANFTPNPVWDLEWDPSQGPNCDSTVLALEVGLEFDPPSDQSGDER